MAMKSITLITALVVVLAATQAEAQLPPRIRLSVFNITGNVPCSVNGSTAVNSTNPLPPFPNARVQLSCNGTVRATTITNRRGAFMFILSGLQMTLNNLISSCRAVVVTPLSTCNATLPPNGTLQAPLQVTRSRAVGSTLNVTDIIARPFQYASI